MKIDYNKYQVIEDHGNGLYSYFNGGDEVAPMGPIATFKMLVAALKGWWADR